MVLKKMHPLLVAASTAVLLFSLLGAAALTGILPAGNTRPAEPGALARRLAADHAQAGPSFRPPLAQSATGACPTCGVVESIRPVEVKGEASGVGAVTGGVAGGLLGNQIGHGTTRTLLTIGGAAGGAYAGNEIERNVKKHTVWRVGVRLEDGVLRTLTQREPPPFAVGDRVRVVDGMRIERA